MLNNKVRLCVGHQHSQFWTILARFMDHYSLFWGPGVISTIDEPGARLHVSHQHSRFFVDPNLFRGLLLAVFGVPKRFPWLLNPTECLHVSHQ